MGMSHNMVNVRWDLNSQKRLCSLMIFVNCEFIINLLCPSLFRTVKMLVNRSSLDLSVASVWYQAPSSGLLTFSPAWYVNSFGA